MMPVANDQSERPGCVPTLKDEPFLPSIKSMSPTKSEKGLKSSRYHNTKENNTARERLDSTGHSLPNSYPAPVKMYSSAPGSESSTPFKLPTIDRTDSYSVASLVNDNNKHGRKSMGRSRERRSRLCRSPSCPSLAYWGDHPESPRSSRLNDSTEHVDAHVRPFYTHREHEGIKLPNIYNSKKGVNSSFTLSSTATSSGQNSRDASPFHFKREATFLNISHNELAADGPATHVTNQHTFVEGDNISRSSTQSSALLLPISSCHDPQLASKSKRKRKKQTGLLVSSEVGSETEKLLREKLGAIERRDFERSNPPHNEAEKTDLSDTAFIEKVQDETNIANGASEPLTTKPPMYQNSPARIKTEKKVAPVKA